MTDTNHLKRIAFFSLSNDHAINFEERYHDEIDESKEKTLKRWADFCRFKASKYQPKTKTISTSREYQFYNHLKRLARKKGWSAELPDYK